MIFPGEFVKVMTATIGEMTYDYKQIRLKLRDDLEYLDTPILQRVFSGTGGIDGDASVEGTAVQRVYGYIPFAPVRLIDYQKLIYMVTDIPHFDNTAANNTNESDWESPNFFNAWDGGVVITRWADYSTEYELENVPPASGTVRFYLPADGPVCMRLGSSPVYDLRVTVTDNNEYVGTMLSEITGVTSNNGLSIYSRVVTDTSETYADFMADQARSRFYNIWADIDNEIKAEIFIYNPSAATSTFDFTENNITSVTFEKPLPAYKITMNMGQVFPGTTASGAADDIKAQLSKQNYRVSYTRDIGGVIGQHKLARSVVITTKAEQAGVDLETILDRYESLYDVDRIFATVQIKSGFDESMVAIDLNDVVTLTLPRYGLSSGKKMTVVGIRHDYQNKLLSFTLWG